MNKIAILNNMRDPTGYGGLSLVLIVSLYYIFMTFGCDFIRGSASFWRQDQDDVAQYLSAINMFVTSPWKFPLLAFNSFNYPQGTTVMFMDGLPIFSLLLKIILPKNISFFNPLGYWLVFGFVLQGVGAWWITKELEIKSWFFLFFLVVTFLTYPALIARLRHIPLMSHWLLLFSIALYLKGLRLKKIPLYAWIILLFFGAYLDIYLFVMSYGVFAVAIMAGEEKVCFRSIVYLLAPMIFIYLSLYLFIFPLPENSLEKVRGFHAYSMNLLAPFFGGKFIHVTAENFIKPTQYEGYNYLGLGVLMACVGSVFFWPSKWHHATKKHWALFALLLIYTIYSLSDHIYLGGKLVATIHYPAFFNFIIGQLRAPGRFFWLVGYIIIIFSTLTLYRHLNKKLFSFFISLLLFIQLEDISNIYAKLKNEISMTYPLFLNYSELDKSLTNNIKYIYLYPKFLCQNDDRPLMISITRYAALHHVNLNTGYIARSQSVCDDVAVEIKNSSHHESIYLFSKMTYKDFNEISVLMGNKNIVCQNLSKFYVCRFNFDS